MHIQLLPQVLLGSISTTSTWRAPWCLHTAGTGLAASEDATQENKSCHSRWLFQTWFLTAKQVPARSCRTAVQIPSRATYRNAALIIPDPFQGRGKEGSVNVQPLYSSKFP